MSCSHPPRSPRLLLHFLFLCWLALGQPLLAEDQWILLESTHLEAISNAGEERTRQVIDQLSRFRHVALRLFELPDVERTPVTVFVFKDDASFEPYKPLYQGKTANLSGFFNRRLDRNIIALDAASEWSPLRLIQHEFLHLITSYRRHPFPLWLSEGLAEFYSTFKTTSKQATIGELVPTHLEMIRQRGLYRMRDLLSFDQKDSVYNEQDKQELFYAQSWLLVHYLTFGESQRYRNQLNDFLKLLDTGVDPAEAFPRAFPDFSLGELEKRLREYARRPSSQVLRYPLPVSSLDPEFRIQPLSEGVVLAHLGDLLFQADRFREAAEHYQRALTLEPDSPHPHEGLAFLAWREGRADQAHSHIEAAIQRNSKSPLLYYRWAENRMRDLGLLERHRSRLGGTQLEPVEASILQAIQLAPRYDRAHYLLATLLLRTSRELERGLEAIGTAILLNPQNEYYQLTLADLLLETREYQGAKQVLRKLNGAQNADIRRHAIARLEYLDNLEP